MELIWMGHGSVFFAEKILLSDYDSTIIKKEL